MASVYAIVTIDGWPPNRSGSGLERRTGARFRMTCSSEPLPPNYCCVVNAITSHRAPRASSWCIWTASPNRRRPATPGPVNARPAAAFDSARRCGSLLLSRATSGADRSAGAGLAACAFAHNEASASVPSGLLLAAEPARRCVGVGHLLTAERGHRIRRHRQTSGGPVGVSRGIGHCDGSEPRDWPSQSTAAVAR
jgi:hypothetical protein